MMMGMVSLQVLAPNAHWGQTNQNVTVQRREGFIAGPYKETGGSHPKSLELRKVFLKTRWGRDVVCCCTLLSVGILFCTCPRNSGLRAPANLQQDKCSFLVCRFHVFISGCAWPLLLRMAFSRHSELGLRSRFGAQAPHCSGFFCCRARAVGFVGCGSCGMQPQLPRGMRDRPD